MQEVKMSQDKKAVTRETAPVRGSSGAGKALVTREQTVEFGQVTILAALFLSLYTRDRHYVQAAFALTLLTMIVPRIFYPCAVAWFRLSGLLNAISTRVFMSLVFFVVVVPVGLYRRARGKDPLVIKRFKRDSASVMRSRNHIYVKEDLLKTF
jgi:hypothetical protein